MSGRLKTHLLDKDDKFPLCKTKLYEDFPSSDNIHLITCKKCMQIVNAARKEVVPDDQPTT